MVKNHLILRMEPDRGQVYVFGIYYKKAKPRIKDLVAIISVLINRKHNSCGLRESTTSLSLPTCYYRNKSEVQLIPL